MYRKLLLSISTICGISCSYALEPMVDVSFENFAQNLKTRNKGSFEGCLPKGVKADFPAWNHSIVVTKKLKEDNLEFLRFNVKKFDEAVLFSLPGKIEGKYYKLQVYGRCPDSPLNLHIRKKSYPYTTYLNADIAKNKSWEEYKFIFQLDDKRVPYKKLGLYLSLKKGITDVAFVKLTKSSREEYIKNNLTKIKRPEKGLKNLFRNSRFPLGRQTGWHGLCEYESDKDNPGPSGAPSLKIKLSKYKSLFSEPFQTDDPDSDIHISFAYKAEAKCGFTIMQGHKKTSIIKSLPVTKKWKRVELTFSPAPLVRGFGIGFYGRGTLYIDSLMAYSGKESQPYASQGECEIALAPNNTEIKNTRIQFSDEKALVRYYATGSFNNTLLRAKVINLYGEEKELPAVNLNKNPLGHIDYGVFEEKSLGQFRVEVWAEKDGKRVSPYNEIVMTRIRRPHYWGKDAPESPFGGHFDTGMAKMMKAAGMNWVRLVDNCMQATCWAWLEPEKGKWDFSADAKIKVFRKEYMKVYGFLGSCPPWASTYSGRNVKNGYFDKMGIPKDINAFRNYIRKVVSHYKGLIDEYQFQNEPWASRFWYKDYDPETGKFSQQGTGAKDYAKFSKIAYEELKKVYPEARLIGFNTKAGNKGRKWTKDVFDYGAYQYCDGIDYHYYNSRELLDCVPTVKPDIPYADKAYEDIINYISGKVKPPLKPVIMSEGNPMVSAAVPWNKTGSNDYSGMYKHTLPWESTESSKLVKLADSTCRFVIAHLSLGVKRIFLYSDKHFHTLLDPSVFPVLAGSDGLPYPTLPAFSNMAWLLEDRKFIKRVPVGKGVWAYIFSGKGKSVAVISGLKDGAYTVPQNGKFEILDLFGNQSKRVYQGHLLYVVSELSPHELAPKLK